MSGVPPVPSLKLNYPRFVETGLNDVGLPAEPLPRHDGSPASFPLAPLSSLGPARNLAGAYTGKAGVESGLTVRVLPGTGARPFKVIKMLKF